MRMYLYLGQGVVLSENDIIGIFDMDNTTSSYISREFLSEVEKSGMVISVSDEIPNSFVVCGADGDYAGKMKVYLSQLSSQTLSRRSGTMRFD